MRCLLEACGVNVLLLLAFVERISLVKWIGFCMTKVAKHGVLCNHKMETKKWKQGKGKGVGGIENPRNNNDKQKQG